MRQQAITRHRENFWAFTGPRRDFGLILLILNMIIHRRFTGPTHLLSANVRGPVSFAVSALPEPMLTQIYVAISYDVVSLGPNEL